MSHAQLLGRYLKPHGHKVVLLAVFLLSSIALQLLAPQIIRRFIDAVAAGAGLPELTQMAVLFLVAAVANQVLAAASTYLSASVGWSSTNALRVDLFRHALSLDLRYHKERTPGEFIERIDGDVTHLSNFFSQFAVRVGGSVLLVAGILAVLWREDWRAGLVITAYVALVTAVLLRRREVAVPATQAERELNAQLFGFIEERLAGLDDIRANGAGRYVMNRLLDLQRRWYGASMRAWYLRSTLWLGMMLLMLVGHLLVLGMAIGLFRAGVITLGTAYLFFNYLTMLEAPLDEVIRQLQEFQKAGAGARRVRELLSEQRDVHDGPVTALPAGAHRVSFHDVHFGYGDQGVLQGLTFQLEKGERLGLLGRTGSGKSTLVRLLLRLYDPSSGAIELDGIDLRQLSVGTVRRRIGMVSQDVQLFQGTVRDNLTFFDPTVSNERLTALLHEVGLWDWIESLPKGLDTELQAGGSGLSAGESQLLAFARVLLQDPGVVILDEPTSRLDPATEQRLARAIDRLLAGRTGIIIAHRLETVQRVDKIMVLSRGRIVEFGDRQALARDPHSIYHAMLAVGAQASVDNRMDAGLDERLERIGL